MFCHQGPGRSTQKNRSLDARRILQKFHSRKSEWNGILQSDVSEVRKSLHIPTCVYPKLSIHFSHFRNDPVWSVHVFSYFRNYPTNILCFRTITADLQSFVRIDFRDMFKYGQISWLKDYLLHNLMQPYSSVHAGSNRRTRREIANMITSKSGMGIRVILL